MKKVDSLCDLGHARNDVVIQCRMLQQKAPPEDFVFATGRQETLLGDPSKALAKLGWQAITTLEDLVAELVEHDKEEAPKELLMRLIGFNVVSSMENRPTNPRAVEQTSVNLDG